MLGRFMITFEWLFYLRNESIHLFKGKTYYFCCPACKPRFDKEPAKIVANAAKGKYEKM